jgi:hypothetical protein
VPQGGCDIVELSDGLLPRSAMVLDGDDGLAADPLDFAAAQALIPVVGDPLGICGDYLKFQAGTRPRSPT